MVVRVRPMQWCSLRKSSLDSRTVEHFTKTSRLPQECTGKIAFPPPLYGAKERDDGQLEMFLESERVTRFGERERGRTPLGSLSVGSGHASRSKQLPLQLPKAEDLTLLMSAFSMAKALPLSLSLSPARLPVRPFPVRL